MLVKVNPASGFYVIHKKILTIAEDDNSVHTCSLSAFLPPNTKAIIIEATRTCAVALVVYPNSGSDDINVTDKALTFLPVSGAEIKYAADNGNTHVVCCYAAFIEGTIKQ